MVTRQPHPEVARETCNPAARRANLVLDQNPDRKQAIVAWAILVERGRIARVLHDDILQEFAVCLLRAQLGERHARNGRCDLARQEMSRLQDALNGTVEKIRELVASLGEMAAEHGAP